MRLLIVSQYFWPEQFIINDLAKALRTQGHSIVVVTGKPNYPDGRIFSGYRAKGVQKEIFGGDIEVIRVPLRTRGRAGRLDLFLNYLSFVWSGVRLFPALLADYVFDCILVFAPSPITMAIAAIPLKRAKRAHLAIWVQDLWPENLAATGYLRNRLALAVVGLVVRAIYAFADTLLVQSRAFFAPVSKYARCDKIVYYPNSVPDPTLPPDEVTPLPAHLVALLKTHFCVVVAGNIGRAQSVESIVDAARSLRDLRDVRIVCVGNGSMKPWLERAVSSNGLDNLVLTGRYPMSAMPELYRYSDCLLVTLRNEEFLSYTIPSKVQAYLAAGKPIIAAANGETARVIAEAQAGLTCAAEDALGLANCVRAMYAMSPLERAGLGDAGNKYFLEHFEMNKQASHLIEVLEERIAASGRRS